MKRWIDYSINAILVLVILGIIGTIWLPAIYGTEWFHRHFLK